MSGEQPLSGASDSRGLNKLTRESEFMDTTQTKLLKKNTPPESDPTKIDRNAPAGSENSLGEESVRDGRPSTDDNIVEAIDEETPGLAGN